MVLIAGEFDPEWAKGLIVHVLEHIQDNPADLVEYNRSTGEITDL